MQSAEHPICTLHSVPRLLDDALEHFQVDISSAHHGNDFLSFELIFSFEKTANSQGSRTFLLGSTEWGEQFAEELRENLVVYINRESYTAGFWSASSNHSLEPFIIETSRDAPHPDGGTLYDSWAAQQPRSTSQVGALGSGSDYTVFLDHLGVPSMSLGFGSGNGIYHSLYDTFSYFQRFGDPGYGYGSATPSCRLVHSQKSSHRGCAWAGYRPAPRYESVCLRTVSSMQAAVSITTRRTLFDTPLISACNRHWSVNSGAPSVGESK